MAESGSKAVAPPLADWRSALIEMQAPCVRCVEMISAPTTENGALSIEVSK